MVLKPKPRIAALPPPYRRLGHRHGHCRRRRRRRTIWESLRCRLRRASSRSAAPLSGRCPRDCDSCLGRSRPWVRLLRMLQRTGGCWNWRRRSGRFRSSCRTPGSPEPCAIVGTGLRRHKARIPPGMSIRVLAADSLEVRATHADLDLEPRLRRAFAGLSTAPASNSRARARPARGGIRSTQWQRSAPNRSCSACSSRSMPAPLCADSQTRSMRPSARPSRRAAASPVRSILL